MPTFTISYPKQKNFRFNTLAFLVFSFCFFARIVFPHTAEFRMHVGDGGTRMDAKDVYLYNMKTNLVNIGKSKNYQVEANTPPINFKADLTDGQENTLDSCMGPVSPGIYLLKIDDVVCKLTIPPFNSSYSADFVIIYASGQFSYGGNHNNDRQIIIENNHTWTVNNVTLKNSFNAAGQMRLDGDINPITIPTGGITFSWEMGTFPHTLNAIDQQPTGITYMQRFYNWTTDGSNPTTDRDKTIASGSHTYQANFQNEYNITFQNIFSGSTYSGKIIVGIERTAPYQTTAVANPGIYATAEDNYIPGVVYSFNHWSDSSTEAYNHHFSPTGNQTYTAYYIGKPTVAYRNLHYNASNPNQPITILWSENPDSNVKQYQIWRRVKYDKQPTGSPVLLSTVNRGTLSYVDYDYAGTNLGFTKWILWYDVRPYFSPDHTYSDSAWALVFSNGPLAKGVAQNKGNNSEIVLGNKIENYPNPFNPSTIISYQIVNPGFVSLKVYNCLGKEIAELVNENQYSGKYNVSFKNANLASGIYFYRIVANGFVETKKMILTK